MTIKRLYRCVVVGAGMNDDEFRPKVADYAGVSWAVREHFAAGAQSVAVEVTADADAHALLALDPGVTAM